MSAGREQRENPTLDVKIRVIIRIEKINIHRQQTSDHMEIYPF